jgi:acyl-CoA thioester hydrolase
VCPVAAVISSPFLPRQYPSCSEKSTKIFWGLSIWQKGPETQRPNHITLDSELDLSPLILNTSQKSGFREVSMANGRSVKIPIEVRFRDIDAMRYVNNAVYFTYFEEARKEFLNSAFKIYEPSSYFFILASIGCEFIKPIQLGDKIAVHIWIGTIGNKSFSFKYLITDSIDKTIVYAKGESVQVYYDYNKNVAMPIPDDIKNILKEYLENSERA